MKHIAKSAVAAVLATFILLFSVGCSDGLISMKISGDQLEDALTGVSYSAAPFFFEPVAIGAEYAAYSLGGTKVKLYEIAGLEPTQWLTEDNDGVYFLFYNSELTLPTLAEFAPTAVHLCVQSVRTWEFDTVTDMTEIAALVSLWETSENVRHPGTTPLTTLRFKFSSDKYPGLYYALIYADYGDARYLYNREMTRCIEIGDMLSAYIDGVVEPVTGETT